jgi:hypothetical protein
VGAVLALLLGLAELVALRTLERLPGLLGELLGVALLHGLLEPLVVAVRRVVVAFALQVVAALRPVGLRIHGFSLLCAFARRHAALL